MNKKYVFDKAYLYLQGCINTYNDNNECIKEEPVTFCTEISYLYEKLGLLHEENKKTDS